MTLPPLAATELIIQTRRERDGASGSVEFVNPAFRFQLAP